MNLAREASYKAASPSNGFLGIAFKRASTSTELSDIGFAERYFRPVSDLNATSLSKDASKELR